MVVFIFHKIHLLVCVEDAVVSFVWLVNLIYFGDLWRGDVVWFLCPAMRVNLQFVPLWYLIPGITRLLDLSNPDRTLRTNMKTEEKN